MSYGIPSTMNCFFGSFENNDEHPTSCTVATSMDTSDDTGMMPAEDLHGTFRGTEDPDGEITVYESRKRTLKAVSVNPEVLNAYEQEVDTLREVLAKSQAECAQLFEEKEVMMAQYEHEAKMNQETLLQSQHDHGKLLAEHDALMKCYKQLEKDNDQVRKTCLHWKKCYGELQARKKVSPTELTRARNECESLKQVVQELKESKNVLISQCNEARLMAQRSIKKAEEWQKEAEEAKKTYTKLYQMLDTQVVERRAQGRGEFPNGDEIESMVLRNQEEADDFFRDLSDLLPDEHQAKNKSNHETILQLVLMPICRIAFHRARAFENAKLENLIDLIADAELLKKNQLVSLLWKSSMQARVMEKVHEEEPQPRMTEEELTQVCISEEAQARMKWVWHPDTQAHPEMEDRHSCGFLTDFFNLELLCRFSHPECFLHPKTGIQVEYDPAHHKLKQLPGRNSRKVPYGREVIVLYPGLYFAHPETEEHGKPITPKVKAIVVQLSDQAAE